MEETTSLRTVPLHIPKQRKSAVRYRPLIGECEPHFLSNCCVHGTFSSLVFKTFLNRSYRQHLHWKAALQPPRSCGQHEWRMSEEEGGEKRQVTTKHTNDNDDDGDDDDDTESDGRDILPANVCGVGAPVAKHEQILETTTTTNQEGV